MNTRKLFRMHPIIMFLSLLFCSCNAIAGEYAALNGLSEVKAVFDVRSKNIKTAALQLDLIHKLYYHNGIREVTEHPEIIIVFSSRAVKMISRERDGYTEEEKMLLDLMADKVSAMAGEGIRMEVCMFALDVYDVEPQTIPPEVHQVDNGWISILGYQAKGYSLVPVY